MHDVEIQFRLHSRLKNGLLISERLRAPDRHIDTRKSHAGSQKDMQLAFGLDRSYV